MISDIERTDAYFRRKRPRTSFIEALERAETQVIVLLLYRNWWTVFADYLKLHKKNLIQYRLNNGTRYNLRPGTTDRGILNETWIRRDYSPDGFELNPTDTILDIGGHIGAFTVWAARRANKGMVISYEPTSANFMLLEKNVQDNHLSNVRLFKQAVSDERGSAEIALASQNTGGHSLTVGLFEKTKQTVEIVETVTLADIFSHNQLDRVNFLKIDCEGAEYPIFFNAPKELLGRIDRIAMEYHELSSTENGQAMKAFLEQTGLFRVWIYRSLLYAVRVEH